MGGPENQRTGRRGEVYVRMLLEDGGITCGALDPDHGEDLLIEVDGSLRAPTGEPALAALVQVKGHDADGPNGLAMERKIQRKHLLRWSAQQLPVFLVAVYLGGQEKRIYAEAIDRFLAEGVGVPDISKLEQEEFSVPLQKVDDLAAFLRAEVTEFHRKVGPRFENLSPSELQDSHLEVIDRRPGLYAPHVSWFHWQVIWKSPRRPAFFAAALSWLLEESRAEYSTASKPPSVCFHIYRSLAAIQANTAVARVDFVNPDHPRGPELLASLKMEPLRIRAGSESEPLRAYLESKTASPQEFANFVRALAPKIDALTEALLQARTAAEAERAWTPDLRQRYRQIDEEYESAARAPLEFRSLEKHVQAYLSALWGHYRFAVKIRDIPWTNTERRISEAREELEGFYKSWRHLLQSRGW
jgi:hypothetical protein